LVAAGIHQRPQDLSGMSVDSVLGLRGFWSKSLVDLLTAMEFVIDHPEAPRKPRDDRVSTIQRTQTSGRYPRPNQRIAPSVLKDLLDVPIPYHLAQGTSFVGKQLADLDETAWRHFSAEVIAELAGLVVSQVTVGAAQHDLSLRPLPATPAGLRLEDLKLENRTCNCLRRAGLSRDLKRLEQMTLGDLMGLPAFGAKCLVDALTALEAFTGRRRQIDVELAERVEELAAVSEASTIFFSDPRLGRLLRTLDSESNTVAEFVARLRRRELNVTEPFRLTKGIRRLVDELRCFQSLAVEEELRDIFSPSTNERDQRILASYYNWDGSGRHTLEQLGSEYGLSRERIRQICMRCLRRIHGVPIHAPVLDRTLAFMAQRLPRSAAGLERELREAGLSRHGLSAAAIEEAAGCFSRPIGFRVVPVGDGAVVLDRNLADLPPQIAHAAKDAVGSFGVATVHDVRAELAASSPRRQVTRELLCETLLALPDFQWLDDRQQWFRLESLPQYGLPNMIEKVVAVAERIDVSRLRVALGRYRRSNRKLPPTRALLEYCRHMPNVRVEEDMVCVRPSLDWRTLLAGVEHGMVEVLKEFGPVMDRGEFEERCIARGMNRFSFNAILMCSPVVSQYGRSIYGLVAQKPDLKTVRRVRARRAKVGPSHVMQACGVAPDGRSFVAYRLSKAAISGGVITIPAALKEHVAGEYAVVSARREPLGRMMAKRGCGWGLGPALRGSGAQPGDHLHLHFDNATRTALLRLENGAAGVGVD
ncbi:MAG: sigma factor-like helix-turn-helix DNA-binding protein, partial [Patescibacteria group bacterium]|nr:sigma factor-like helix-turn-helix DNA-binding protein [Patescibacteria group bacterium]